MSWLIKTDQNKLQVWSDHEYFAMREKCEYYGAKPHWEELQQLEDSTNIATLDLPNSSPEFPSSLTPSFS